MATCSTDEETIASTLVYASAACNKGSQMFAMSHTGISIFGSNNLIALLNPLVSLFIFDSSIGCNLWGD